MLASVRCVGGGLDGDRDAGRRCWRSAVRGFAVQQRGYAAAARSLARVMSVLRRGSTPRTGIARSPHPAATLFVNGAAEGFGRLYR
jgi:hypothetical protein